MDCFALRGAAGADRLRCAGNGRVPCAHGELRRNYGRSRRPDRRAHPGGAGADARPHAYGTARGAVCGPARALRAGRAGGLGHGGLRRGRPEQAWGYALRDLDGDGAPELLIGNGREIFDLYALQDGAPKKLLTGWERNAYVLCEDGTIYNTASGGAAYTVFADYAVREGALVPVKTVVFDTDAWTAYDGAEGEGEGVPLTEEEARAWMDGHAVQTVEITLLHEAQPLSE